MGDILKSTDIKWHFLLKMWEKEENCAWTWDKFFMHCLKNMKNNINRTDYS